jgi:hypothetical protein
MIEQTITVGNLIEITAILGGGLAAFFTLKSTVSHMKDDLKGMQDEIKKLGEILIAQADIRGELKVLGARIGTTEKDIRELRHGEGFVKGPRGVEHEWP